MRAGQNCVPFNLLSIAFVGVSLIGCDDSNTLPPEIQEQLRQQEQQQTPKDPSAKPRPATQELVNEANYKRISLQPLPLTLNVPPGWKPEPFGPRTLLEGYSPTDLVRIQLAQRPHLTDLQYEALLSGTQKEQANANAGARMTVDMRDHRGMKILGSARSGYPIH
jgi:hypothetical protein